ncbi:MAG: hypothetical protein M0Q88_07980 [Bacilli bacterium]|nr:hypothetical protein [Bacilli bacterium]
MIISKGQKIVIDDKEFIVGDYYAANNSSVYSGKIGLILEVKTSQDKDTDNIGPDIYVDFGDGEVIMAADMLEELPF